MAHSWHPTANLAHVYSVCIGDLWGVYFVYIEIWAELVAHQA